MDELRYRLLSVWTNFVQWADEATLHKIRTHLDEWWDEMVCEGEFGDAQELDPRGEPNSNGEIRV